MNLCYEPDPGCNPACDGPVICLNESKLLKAKQPIFMNALKKGVIMCTGIDEGESKKLLLDR